MTRNILIVTQYFPPEIGGGSQRSWGFAAELSNLDTNVIVLTPFPSYLMHKDERKIKYKLYEKSVENRLTIFRTFVLATDRGGFVKRLLYYFSFNVSSLFVALIHIRRIDFVLTISPPLFNGITGVLIKKIKKSKLIFDIGDLWPESAVQLGFLRNTYLIKLAEKLEKWIYRNSDFVNVVTRKTFEKVEFTHPYIPQLQYVPNFVDTENVISKGKNEQLLKKYELEDKLVFGYAGNIGSAQGVDIITKAAGRTKELNDIVYLIIGDGIERIKLENDIKKMELKNVLLLPPVNKDHIVNFISLFDVMIIPLVKNELFKITIPSKLYESMSAEIPVLLCVDGEARNIMENANCGIFVEPENHIMLSEKVIQFHSNKSLISELGTNGRISVLNNFSRQKVIKSFYEDVILNNLP
jgi:glycosyltransferase involved in cell wall biosynthesis